MKSSSVMKRQLVSVAANELAHEVEFDDITVDMICERAQISRSSFYRLFRDKYDILLWCEKISFSRGVSQMGLTLTCGQGVTATLECFRLFNPLFLSTCRSSERAPREEAGKAEASRILRATLEEHREIAVDEELDFQIRWFVSGLLDQVVVWSRANCPGTPAEVAALIESCCPPRLHAILDRPPRAGDSDEFSLQKVILEGPLA